MTQLIHFHYNIIRKHRKVFNDFQFSSLAFLALTSPHTKNILYFATSFTAVQAAVPANVPALAYFHSINIKVQFYSYEIDLCKCFGSGCNYRYLHSRCLIRINDSSSKIKYQKQISVDIMGRGWTAAAHCVCLPVACCLLSVLIFD